MESVKELNKQLKKTRTLIADLKHERERVKIGFLNGETPILMSLLNRTMERLEKLTKEIIIRRREIKRLQQEKRKLEAPEIPQLPEPSQRAREKKKAKRFGLR